jgi:hypothetical protein
MIHRRNFQMQLAILCNSEYIFDVCFVVLIVYV